MKPGVYFALNVANVQRGSVMLPLPDLALSIFNDMPNWEFSYLWGLRINRRNTCEPVLVWQKRNNHVR